MRNLDSPTYVYEAAAEPLTRRRWLTWLIVLGVWILLGCIYATPVYLEMRAERVDHAALRIFSWGILTWLIWAVLTPFIVAMGRRFPLDVLRWKRSLLVHVPFFLLMAVIHSAVAV